MDKKQTSKQNRVARKPVNKSVQNLMNQSALPRPGQQQRFVAAKLKPNDILDLQRTIGMRATQKYIARQMTKREQIQRTIAVSKTDGGTLQRFSGSSFNSFRQLIKMVMDTPNIAKMNEQDLRDLIYATYSLEGGKESTDRADDDKSIDVTQKLSGQLKGWKKTVEIQRQDLNFLQIHNNKWNAEAIMKGQKKRMSIHATQEAMFLIMDALATKIMPMMPLIESAKLGWHWQKMFKRFDSIIIYFVEVDGQSETAILEAIAPYKGMIAEGTPAMMQPTELRGVATAEDTGGSFGDARAWSLARALSGFYKKNPAGQFEEGFSWVAKALEKEGYNVNDLSKTKGEAKKDNCFLTTACITVLGLPDDCEELMILRQFRDGYMRSLPQGEALIREYYRVAPLIVAEIDGRADAKGVYAGIYGIVQSCIGAIGAGELARALAEYQQMVWDLQASHLGGSHG